MASRRRSILDHESAPGAFLLVAACISMALANSPLSSDFESILKTQFGWRALHLHMPVSSWIKDALMSVFFLFVGLELKREFVDGELRDVRRAVLPLAGAIGGMAGPAAIYLLFNAASPESLAGWGIPMATDIAFALGVLSLLGRRVPPTLKTFLLALAIVDDLGAILIIALFYGEGLDLAALGVALALFAGALALNRAGVVLLWPYLLLGLPLWVAMHASGVHATVAGVLLALTIPYRTQAAGRLREPPLLKLEHGLREWVMFGIMPVFALANAGVSFAGVSAEHFVAPATLGIALGLFVGKPIGIMITTLAAGRVTRTPLPFSVAALAGVGLIAGVGFTMSLFISALAFEDPALIAEARIGVFAGSIAAALAGLLILIWSLRQVVATEEEERAAVEPFLVEDGEQR